VIESSQAYERVKERDRLAVLGEMAAGLAHEIRNPLGAIKGAAQLLQTPTGKGGSGLEAAESTELLEIIVEEANRLNNVVSRFLDYARSDRRRDDDGKADVNALIRKLVGVLQQSDDARHVEVRSRFDDQLPAVAGDAEAFFQVFLNLGLNALQSMPDGGTLEIITTRRRRSPLGYGQFVEVRFRDTGVGIARDKLKKLFIPFYTTKASGTGLGLAISQRIVSQHGGSIEVRSTPGQGSTFSVFLPSEPGAPDAATTTGPIIMEPPAGGRPSRRDSTGPTPEPGEATAPAASPDAPTVVRS
jgi:two-component system sensor histidine kinase HydH